MREQWWLAAGISAVLSMGVPVLSAAEKDDEDDVPTLSSQEEDDEDDWTPQQRCEKSDFSGYAHEAWTMDSDDIHGFELRYQSGGGLPAPYERLDDHFASLDRECQQRCQAPFNALQQAIAERNREMDEYNTLVKAANQRIEAATMRPGQGGVEALGSALSIEVIREELEADRKALSEADDVVADAKKAYKACACPCTSDEGLSGRTKVAGGAAILGAVATGATLLGGGTQATPAQGPGPTPGTPPVSNPGPFDPSGTYVLVWVVLEDGRLSAQFVRLQDVRELRVVINGSTATLDGPFPFTQLTGPWNANSGEITATGSGPLAGRANVGVTLSGILSQAGLRARVVVGADGSLGGQQPHTVVYEVMGPKRP